MAFDDARSLLSAIDEIGLSGADLDSHAAALQALISSHSDLLEQNPGLVLDFIGDRSNSDAARWMMMEWARVFLPSETATLARQIADDVSDHQLIRMTAIHALRPIGLSETDPLTQRLIHDEDAHIRRVTMSLIETPMNAALIERAALDIEHDDHQVQVEAIRFLSRSESDEARMLIMDRFLQRYEQQNTLLHPNPIDRVKDKYAVRALGSVGSRDSFEELLKIINNETEHIQIRMAATDALLDHTDILNTQTLRNLFSIQNPNINIIIAERLNELQSFGLREILEERLRTAADEYEIEVILRELTAP